MAKPLTRPLVWGKSPPQTRHRLALYAAAATNARSLAVTLRHHPGLDDGPALACGALATVAEQVIEAAPGKEQPITALALAEADAALFGGTGVAPGEWATDPVIRPLIHMHRVLRELAEPGTLAPAGATPKVERETQPEEVG